MTVDEQGAMWDCRERLIADLRTGGVLPERTLYIRRQDGGAYALGRLKGGTCALSIDWRMDSANFAMVNEPRMIIDSYVQKADGFGGVFGIGEKGGIGWMLHLMDGETSVWEVSLLPGTTAIADLLYSEDRFLNGKRKKRGVPLWQLRPENTETCRQILSVWMRLFGEEPKEESDRRRCLN